MTALRLAACCLVVAAVAVCAYTAATHPAGPGQPIPTVDTGTGGTTR